MAKEFVGTSMDRLAFILVVDDRGQDVALPATDVRLIREHPNGSSITLWDGTVIITGSSVSTVRTAIDTLWDEWITAIT